MRDLTEQQQKEQIVAAFANYIDEHVPAKQLAGYLEGVMWGYAMYMLRDEDLCGHAENTNSIYFLKELVDILRLE